MSFRLARRKLRPLEWIQKCWMHFYCFLVKEITKWSEIVTGWFYYISLDSCKVWKHFTETLPIVCNGFKWRLSSTFFSFFEIVQAKVGNQLVSIDFFPCSHRLGIWYKKKTENLYGFGMVVWTHGFVWRKTRYVLINPFTVICAMFLTGQNFVFRTLAVCHPAFEIHARVWSAREVWAPGCRRQRVFKVNNSPPPPPPPCQKHGAYYRERVY